MHKKRGVSPQRYNQQLAVIEDKFSAFSTKIKSLLRNEHEEGKENLNICQGSNMFGLTRSALLRKAEQQVKEAEERQERLTSVPYFIECLRRKTHVTTEACMHIHTSILTFKQYLKTVHLAKPKLPDPRYALQQEGTAFLTQAARLWYSTWMRH